MYHFKNIGLPNLIKKEWFLRKKTKISKYHQNIEKNLLYIIFLKPCHRYIHKRNDRKLLQEQSLCFSSSYFSILNSSKHLNYSSRRIFGTLKHIYILSFSWNHSNLHKNCLYFYSSFFYFYTLFLKETEGWKDNEWYPTPIQIVKYRWNSFFNDCFYVSCGIIYIKNITKISDTNACTKFLRVVILILSEIFLPDFLFIFYFLILSLKENPSNYNFCFWTFLLSNNLETFEPCCFVSIHIWQSM